MQNDRTATKKLATAVMAVGSQNTLLQTLGVPYGVIFKERIQKPVFVYTTDQLKQLLQRSVEGGHITGDNAGELEAAAERIGLLANEESVRGVIKAYEPPPGEELRYTFRVCNKHPEVLPPHGHVYIGEDSVSDAPIFSTNNLEANLTRWIDDEDMTPVNAAVILRDAMRAGIPEKNPSINESSFDAALKILAQRIFGGSGFNIMEIRRG